MFKLISWLFSLYFVFPNISVRSHKWYYVLQCKKLDKLTDHLCWASLGALKRFVFKSHNKYHTAFKKIKEICQKRKFKALKNTFETVKSILIFFCTIHNWPDWFKWTKYWISKHFTKPMEYIPTSSGTIFSVNV